MDRYVTICELPKKRKMIIYRDPPSHSNSIIRGWNFIVQDEENGNWIRNWDTWQMTFLEISKYPDDYSIGKLNWTDDFGDTVYLEDLKKEFE